MGLNRQLLKYASGGHYKAALVPPGMDQGGQPPTMDPSQGGIPAGGMDPGMAGGAPPGPPPGMDQGAAPAPPSPGGGGDIASAIRTAMTDVIAQSGLAGKGNAEAKPAKPDINTIATDVFQLKKLLFAVFKALNLELPPDLLDGPNRDPATGAPTASPDGGSTPAPSPDQAAAPSAISPIEPMQGAFPAGAMGGAPPGQGKSAAVGSAIARSAVVQNGSPVAHAQALALMFRKRQACSP